MSEDHDIEDDNRTIADVQMQKTPCLEKYKGLSDIHPSSIFRITKKDLTLMFSKSNLSMPDNQGEIKVSLNILKAVGYNQGLCRLLNSDAETGIVGDLADINRRTNIFGRHQIRQASIESFIDILSRQFEDDNVISLIWAATVYLIFAFFSPNNSSFIQSLTIFSGLFFACSISGVCDYLKQKQFLLLEQEVNKQKVTVYRGQYGAVKSIKINELVVGDIIEVKPGDRVPADCLLLEEMNMTVDQQIYFQTANTCVEKEQSQIYPEDAENVDNHHSNPDPFLLTDSKIMTGHGKAIVCAVGANTLLARIRGNQEFKIMESSTHLDCKLDSTAKQIGKYALLVMAAYILTSIVFQFIYIMYTDANLISNETLLKFCHIGIVAVVIMIVAIPEGLPLSVSLAMSFSVGKLKDENILIKNIEALQKMAMCHEISISKTGCLTTGEMNVAQYQLLDQTNVTPHYVGDSTFIDRYEMSSEVKELLFECILSNTDVRIEENDYTMMYEPCGQEIEVALVKFLVDNQKDIHSIFISRNQDAPILQHMPFDQNLKRKTVVRPVIDNPNLVRIYVKGAPEVIIPLSKKTFNIDGEEIELKENIKVELLSDSISIDMARNGLKVITYAYKEITLQAFNELICNNLVESDDFRELLESDLTYMGTFGLNDPIRDDILNTIAQIKHGKCRASSQMEEAAGKAAQVNVKLVTGDHIETAKHVALACGIVSQSEVNQPGVCMTGDEFQEQIGPYQRIWDQIERQYTIKIIDEEQFNNVRKKLRVLARCTSEDKFVLVTGTKQRGGIVGMTGDSISDAEALKKADIGICMGSGCDVAKDNADLVILDNNFNSIYRSIEWGRAIFDNVKKFLQFQITINIVLCLITVISGATLGQTPLNVIQMLWVNLMMDILGAIALGTEEPRSECDTKKPRISRKDTIIDSIMWRQILVMSAYQLLVMLILIFFGSLIFFETSFNIVTEPLRNPVDHTGTDRMKLNTILFYTFALMNLFNQINCRSLNKDNLNVFDQIHTNTVFILVLLIELTITYWMVRGGESHLLSSIIGTAPITRAMHITCWVLGASVLAVNIIIKKIPIDVFVFFAENVDLENTCKHDDPINQIFGAAEDHFHQVKEKIQPQERNEAVDDEFIPAREIYGDDENAAM